MFLRAKYEKRPPDVVITLGSAALPFIVRHRDEIAPNAPVVFTSVSPQNYGALRLPPNITGIISEFDLDKTLALAERLQPEASRLFVIAGSGEVDRRWQSTARKTIEDRARKFEVTYLFERSYANLVEEVSKIPRDSIVMLLTVFADSEGNAFVPAQVAGPLSAVSPAPVYAPYDTYIGNGIVGGFVETFESVGSSRGRHGASNPRRERPCHDRTPNKSGTDLSGRSQGDGAVEAPGKQPSSRYCRLVQEADDLDRISRHRHCDYPDCRLAIVDRCRAAASAAEKAARRKSAQGKRRADDVRRRCCQYRALAI